MEHLCEVVCGWSTYVRWCVGGALMCGGVWVEHLCEVVCGVVGRGHICTKNIMKVEGRWNTISHK